MLTQEQQIFEQIKKSKKILITFKRTWNGDAVASALALYLFLKKLDKEVDIMAEKFDQGRIYSFLPGYGQIQHEINNLRKFIISLDITNAQVGQVRYEQDENALNFIISPKEGFFTSDDITSRTGGFNYDLIFTLDTPDLEALGKIYDNDTEFFYKTPIINIDHQSGNEEYGQVNKIELTAVATAEIVFTLLAEYSRDAIDEDIATCLLAGIISKTRSFKTQNITPTALSTASQLISMGARREEIVNRLYRSRPLSVLKLWGRVLARLTSDLDNQLVWSILTRMDFDKTEAGEDDLSEVVDELIVNIPEAKVIVLIYEPLMPEAAPSRTEEGEPEFMPAAGTDSGPGVSAKALIYSIKNINSLNLVKEYNPVGTKSVAVIKLDKNATEAEADIIKTIKDKLAKLPL